MKNLLEHAILLLSYGQWAHLILMIKHRHDIIVLCGEIKNISAIFPFMQVCLCYFLRNGRFVLSGAVQYMFLSNNFEIDNNYCGSCSYNGNGFGLIVPPSISTQVYKHTQIQYDWSHWRLW